MEPSPTLAADLNAAVARIRSADLSLLRSTEWVQHELLPPLGLSSIHTEHYPAALRRYCGTGVQSFQVPIQFAPYLTCLADRAIETYVEVGAWMGGTFIITVEYLSRFRPIRRAQVVDVAVTPPIRAYAAMNPAVSLHEGDSKSPEAVRLLGGTQWDMALVDGDHSEAGCRADYLSVRDSARMIALHDTYNDICPDVGRVWESLRQSLPARCMHEFHAQYPEVTRDIGVRSMGIGLIDFGALAQGR